jgi:hypothetical protein
MKFVLPYAEYQYRKNLKSFIRFIFNDNKDPHFHPQVWQHIDGRWWRNIPHCCYSTKEEAMKNLDNELIKYGYTFITNERAEKLRLLI